MKPVSASPKSVDQPPVRIQQETRTVLVATRLILFTVIGGAAGLAGSIFGGLALELHVASTRPAGPVLSYGQQFGMMIVPLCTLIGAAIGFSVALAFSRYPILAIILLLTTSFVGWGITGAMWNSQVADYGPDPSEVVLYYPPTAMCILAVCASGVVLVWMIFKTTLRIARPVAT